MRVITIARKPCSEPTVAANVLKWGTGAINVDVCRTNTRPPSVPQPAFNSPTGLVYGFSAGEGRCGGMSDNTKGRWPANLILQHKPGCRLVGEQTVPANGKNGAWGPSGSASTYGGGWNRDPTVRRPTYSGPDGNETVEAWECEPGCPVPSLDGQGEGRSAYSGNPDAAIRNSGKPNTNDRSNQVTSFGSKTTGLAYADSGGVTRYFKQVGGQKPQE